MTCIIGLSAGGVAYVGGDSCGTVSDNLCSISGGKVFQVGAFTIGVAGARRAGEVFRYRCALERLTPPVENDDALDRFMSVEFGDALREGFKAAGALLKTDENGETFNGSAIVGVGGRIYFIAGNFSANRTLYNFWATGAGESFALGSLHSTGEKAPRARIEAALEAAAELADGVRPPFTILPPEGTGVGEK